MTSNPPAFDLIHLMLADLAARWGCPLDEAAARLVADTYLRELHASAVRGEPYRALGLAVAPVPVAPVAPPPEPVRAAPAPVAAPKLPSPSPSILVSPEGPTDEELRELEEEEEEGERGVADLILQVASGFSTPFSIRGLIAMVQQEAGEEVTSPQCSAALARSRWPTRGQPSQGKATVYLPRTDPSVAK